MPLQLYDVVLVNRPNRPQDQWVGRVVELPTLPEGFAYVAFLKKNKTVAPQQALCHKKDKVDRKLLPLSQLEKLPQ